MKTAFHLHAVRQHFRAPYPSLSEQAAVFDWVVAAGFDGVDVSDSWGFENITAEDAAATVGLLQDRGLALATVSCMSKTLCHPELGERHLQMVQRGLEVAGWYGCGLVNLALATPRTPGVAPVQGAAHSPGGSRGASDADFALTAERLRFLGKIAADRGIALSVELHDRSLADTSTSLLRLLDAADQTNIFVNPDLCNGYRAYDVPPETWQQALLKLAPRANLWHVNNLNRVHFADIQRAAFVERTLGEGDIDYVWALNRMREAGFDGWVVIEYKGGGDAFETLRSGLDYFRRIGTRPEFASLAH